MALPVINVETDPNKISQQLLDNSDKQIELFENIGKILTGSDKSQIAIQTQMQDASKKYYQREQNIQELVSKGALSNTSMKALKARNKAAFYWEKFGIKHKWLQKVGKGIATIAKGVANLAGNWFFKIIGFLLAMAIFDPSGKMLKSILKMIIGIVVWFVKILATMLPGLIKTMMNLITDVLPGILADLIKGVFPVLSEIFKKLAKDLENDFPIISWFIDALGNAFAKDGILYKFFMALSGMLPVLLGGFLILGAIMKMMPFLKMLFTVLKVGFFVLKILAIAAKALFGLLGPIGIIILLVVGGLILLWNYADKVVGFLRV